MIILHDVLRLLHAQLFIERHRFFVGDQLDRDVLFSTGQSQRIFH